MALSAIPLAAQDGACFLSQSVPRDGPRRARSVQGRRLTSQPPQWQVEPVHLVGLKWAATECQRGREATEACETECEMRSETFDNSRVNSGDKSRA